MAESEAVDRTWTVSRGNIQLCKVANNRYELRFLLKIGGRGVRHTFTLSEDEALMASGKLGPANVSVSEGSL